MQKAARSIFIDGAKWIPVIGYENEYLINDRGDVWSIRNNIVLKPKLSPSGYLRIGLSVNGIRKDYGIHRLVAKAFIENPEGKPTVNHINEIKTDNRAVNLTWATYLEQNTHGTRIQRAVKNTDWHVRSRKMDYTEIARKHDYQAINANQRRAVYQCDLKGTVIRRFSGVLIAAREMGANAGHLCECLKGRRNTCAGYRWKYAT